MIDDASAVGRLSAASGRRPSAAHEIRALGGSGLFRGKAVLEVGTGEGRLALGYAAVARTVPRRFPRYEGPALPRGHITVRRAIAFDVYARR